MKCDAGASERRRATRGRAANRLRSLADVELVAQLLAGGRTDGEEALRLASQLLGGCDGLGALAGTSLAMLRHLGLGEAQAAALLAAREVACRLARHRIPRRYSLDRLEDVARFLVLRFQQRDQEVMGALFLDVRRRLLGEQEIFRGTLHRAAVEPREILKECLLRGAGGVVLFHTHPSGDPTPSYEDLQFTRRMAAAAAVVGVELLDHLVLGATGLWVSLKRQGGW